MVRRPAARSCPGAIHFVFPAGGACGNRSQELIAEPPEIAYVFKFFFRGAAPCRPRRLPSRSRIRRSPSSGSATDGEVDNAYSTDPTALMLLGLFAAAPGCRGMGSEGAARVVEEHIVHTVGEIAWRHPRVLRLGSRTLRPSCSQISSWWSARAFRPRGGRMWDASALARPLDRLGCGCLRGARSLGRPLLDLWTDLVAAVFVELARLPTPIATWPGAHPVGRLW